MILGAPPFRHRLPGQAMPESAGILFAPMSAINRTLYLAKASPADKIWRIGLTQGAPHAADPLQWQGLNLTGFALNESA